MRPPKTSNETAQQKRSRSRRRRAPQVFPAQGGVRFKTQGMLFGDLDPVPFDGVVDPLPKACFNCWSFEHKRKDCTEPRIHDYCFNCGRSGLTVDNCPRCARAYRGLNDDLKKWIYWHFHKVDTDVCEARCEGKKQTTSKKERRGCDNWDHCYDEKQTTPKKERREDANGDEYCNAKTTPKKKSQEDEMWDNYQENDYHQSPNADEHSKSSVIRDSFINLKDEDFSWEPSDSYHSRETITLEETNDLFAYLRDKKIQKEFENDKINNVVNLDDTRMAGRDSLGDNSHVTIENEPKMDEVRLTGEPLRDFLYLLDALKHLPVETQNVVVLQYMFERRQQMVKKGMMQFDELTLKSP